MPEALGNLEERRRRDRHRRRWLSVLAGSVVAGAGALALPHLPDITSPHSMADRTSEADVRLQPLGRPPEVPRGIGSFSFSAEQLTSDDPVAYDPCRPIRYAVNDDLAPDGTEEIVEDAVRAVSRATGLVFERVADTDEHFDSVSSKHGRSPIVIDWTTPDAMPGLTGGTTGLGGSAFLLYGAAGHRVYVTGAVALDALQIRSILRRPNGPALVRAIVMHELGHVVGLDHVQDEDELMNEKNLGQTAFGPGDREGLARLGAGPCFAGGPV